MNNGLFTAVRKYGREITVRYKNGESEKTVIGFLQPADVNGTSKLRRNFIPGQIDKREYLLFLPPDTFDEKADLDALAVCGGEEYEILRAEPLYFEEGISHYECVARKKL